MPIRLFLFSWWYVKRSTRGDDLDDTVFPALELHFLRPSVPKTSVSRSHGTHMVFELGGELCDLMSF